MHTAMAENFGNAVWSDQDWFLHNGEEKAILVPNCRACATALRSSAAAMRRQKKDLAKAAQYERDAQFLSDGADRILREHVVLEDQLRRTHSMDMTLLRNHAKLEDDCVELLLKYGF